MEIVQQTGTQVMQANSGALVPQGASAAPASGEYLTFRLGQEEYGIDILKVQEIRSYEQPTRIADLPLILQLAADILRVSRNLAPLVE